MAIANLILNPPLSSSDLPIHPPSSPLEVYPTYTIRERRKGNNEKHWTEDGRRERKEKQEVCVYTKTTVHDNPGWRGDGGLPAPSSTDPGVHLRTVSLPNAGTESPCPCHVVTEGGGKAGNCFTTDSDEESINECRRVKRFAIQFDEFTNRAELEAGERGSLTVYVTPAAKPHRELV
ncbi:hypothetical protein C0Q70_00599 [Pomacea canaliculata]|uniref:Uncharacterized protein n=1 Tax=Pomacea canaliculata TaxID=400727 RepID=A0A2T7PX40_POMCA|nr:hypothetical protein C0Q70_00599 [Pomacea canaliculata]